MQTTRRPVPSVAALKALRQLAYVASGTACGAAALLYEERRRRIHFLRKVAENGRILKDVARGSRRGYAAAAALALSPSNDIPPPDTQDPWAREQYASLNRYTAQDAAARARTRLPRNLDTVTAQDETLRSEHLPSQVERGYERWQAHHREDGTSGLEATRNKRGMDTDVSSWATPAKQRPQSRFHGGFQDDMRRETQVVKPTTQWVEAWLRSTRSAPDPLSEMHKLHTMLRAAISSWSKAISSTAGSEHDLRSSWRVLSKWALSLEEDDPWLQEFNPQSPTPSFVSAAIQLRLPALLSAICDHVAGTRNMNVVAAQVADALVHSECSRIFEHTRTMLLDWVRMTISGDDLDATQLFDLQWARLQLEVLQEADTQTWNRDDATTDEADTQLWEQDDAVHKETLTWRDLLVDLIEVDGVEMVMPRLNRLVQDLVAASKSAMAVRLLNSCTSTAHIRPRYVHELWLQAFGLVKESVDRVVVIDALAHIHSLGLASDKLIRDIWGSCTTDIELLDMYSAFQLSPMLPRPMLARLLDAIINHCSADTISSEMYGSLGRMWTTVLARQWQTSANLDAIVNQFWKVQRAVGDRLLSPVLYDVTVRKCIQANRPTDADAVKSRRQELSTERSASAAVSGILDLARVGDWDAVTMAVGELNPTTFGTMQIQARAQVFDPLFRAFLSSDRNAQDLFQLGMALVSRIHEHVSPTTAIRLLSMSLVRIGRVDALTALHEYANDLLDKPLELSAVDSADLYRSFYYTYRPSHVALAALVDKSYYRSWQGVSKQHLALLMTSASYETKKSQQRRLDIASHQLIRSALVQIDDKDLQNALLLESRRDTDHRGTRRLRLDDLYPESVDPDGRLPDVFGKVIESSGLQGQADGIERTRASHDSARPAPRQSQDLADTVDSTDGEAVAKGSEDSWVAFHGGAKVRAEDDTDDSAHDGLHAVGSADAYTAHSVTKALLHNAQIPGLHSQVGSLIEKLASENVFAPSASIASLASHAETKDTFVIREILAIAASDRSLVQSRAALTRLQQTNIDRNGLSSAETLAELKSLITDEYKRMESCGHLPDHALVSSLASVMLREGQPGAAIELLRHSLASPWASISPPNNAFMLMLLKAYITLGRADGVRWVCGHMFRNEVRIEKSFLIALREGRKEWETRARRSAPTQTHSQMLAELTTMQKVCTEHQSRQIAQAREAGDQLVNYIAKHAEPATTVTWRADDDFAAGSAATSSQSQQKFKEAVFVHSVCADIVTMAKQNHAPVKRHHSKNMDLRLVRAIKRVERNRAMREVEVWS